MSNRFATRLLAVAVVLSSVLVAARASATPPTVGNLSTRALRIGNTTVVTVTGKNLLPQPRLLLPIEVASQVVQPGASATRIEMHVTLAEHARPGIVPLRMVTAGGISNPMFIAVDELPQVVFGPVIESLPVAMQGNLAGAQVSRTTFRGTAGQRVVVDVACRRLGGTFNPVVRLLDPRGTQIAWSPPQNGIGGDARAATTLPVDGEYTIELSDQLNRGAGFFRLQVGDLQFVDRAFPMAVMLGDARGLQLVGQIADPTAKIDTAELPAPTTTSLRLPGIVGAQPEIQVSAHREWTESEVDSAVQVPAGISGTLGKRSEVDRYEVEVKPGSKLRMELMAERLGSPIDGVLAVQPPGGGVLGRSDDQPNTADPRLDVTVPPNVNRLVVRVSDLSKRGGSDHYYRLTIRDLSAARFDLTVPPGPIHVPAGGGTIVRVTANRQGYDGPISLRWPHLPDGIQSSTASIAAGSTVGLVRLSATGTAPSATQTELLGHTREDGPASYATLPATVFPKRPSLRRWLPVAVTAAAGVELTWKPVDPEAPLVPGLRYPIEVMIKRTAEVTAPVRVRLVTNQVPPTKKVKQKNRDVQVPDAARTLRLEGDRLFPPKVETKTVQLAVPFDLPRHQWSFALVADVLAADKKKTVVGRSAGEIGELPVAANPLTLALAGSGPWVGTIGEPGDAVALEGTVSRVRGCTLPVTIRLEGLPKEVPSPTAIVNPGDTKFSLPLRFVESAKPGELKGVRVVATAQPDPKNDKQLLRSPPQPIALRLASAEKKQP